MLVRRHLPDVGASGGVFGLLLAYGMYFPHNRVMLLFPPIPMPARVFVTLYAVIELFLGVTGSQEGVAHFAHLGGMIGGYLLLRFWRASPRRPVALMRLGARCRCALRCRGRLWCACAARSFGDRDVRRTLAEFLHRFIDRRLKHRACTSPVMLDAIACFAHGGVQ